MAASDGLDAFDGFTRKVEAGGAFNDDQADYMRYLSSLPPEAKCRCGWYEKDDCYNCNHADFRRVGIEHDESIRRNWKTFLNQSEICVLCYRLPDGRMTGYRGAIEYVKRQSV